MTQEEKAKAYDEALERAKKFAIDDAYASQGTVIKLIFPELRESEDEKVRKALVWHLKANADFVSNGVTKEECIAYLEKQKEQKLTDTEWAELQSEFKNINEAFEDGKKEVIDNPEKYGLQKENKFAPRVLPCSAAWFEDDDEKQKEQKPAWSEEDKVMLNSIIWGVHMKSITPLDEMEDRNKYEKYEDFLKSLPERFILQPKQEQQIKEGDKVSIHCRKDRREDITITYDGEVGEVIHVWDAKKHPWGHIIVQLNNGYNTGFYEDELEVLDEPSWKPSEE